MSRLVIISNRLPVTIDRRDGELHYHPSAGGLATGLNSLDESYDKIWIGWPGKISEQDDKDEIRRDLAKEKLVPVFLTNDEIELYYEGFSNKTIWPHFHYFTEYTTYREDFWRSYQEVNYKFFQAVAEEIREDDMVWVHDYQLMLLPNLIRKKFPKVSIGFFLHIPFPSYEVFRILPYREELLEGILGADQIGFHTYNYMRHFLSAAYRLAGYEQAYHHLTIEDRQVNVDVFPMGIDYEKYAHPKVDAAKDKDSQEILELAHHRKIIVSIDRLDYTKGIPQRIRAFRQFLQRHPEYHGKVNLVMLVVPSRSNVDTYKELKAEVDVLVSETNSEYSRFNWIPIRYYYRSLNFAALTTLYRASDIALITPLRDGMNLVAKEYLAVKEDSKKGVLILSEMAGAVHELNDAITVNPQDANRIVEALVTALEMPLAEQAERLERMQEKLKIYNVKQWAATFIEQQQLLKNSNLKYSTTKLEGEETQSVLATYNNAQRRLFIIDYDGTLMDFNVDPQAVSPDEEVIAILNGLASDPKNMVVVNSGRDRSTLQKWLGELPIGMSAEHGVWMKENGEWRLNPNVTDVWKPNVREVLENLVNRTPGSFIEEKDFSLAWHYRGIDKEFGEKRVREFRDVLAFLIQNQDLQVLEGNKVVEIKNAGVNKGKATNYWIGREKFDFVFGIGDDSTDEDIFKSIETNLKKNPAATGISVKVGNGHTEAKYMLPGVKQVREFFNKILD